MRQSLISMINLLLILMINLLLISHKLNRIKLLTITTPTQKIIYYYAKLNHLINITVNIKIKLILLKSKIEIK